MAGCEVETDVTEPQSDHGWLSEQSMQIAVMSVPVKAERASLSPDVDITLTAEAVTPDVHLALTVEAVQSVSSCNRCARRRCPGGRQFPPWTTAALVGFNV
jgi:hypothetical protein